MCIFHINGDTPEIVLNVNKIGEDILYQWGYTGKRQKTV